MTIYSFIALISYMSGMIHAFHISVCEINHNDDNNTLEISQRIFLDDLEEGLILWSGQNGIDIINPQNKQEIDSLIESYVVSHMSFWVNGDAKQPIYLGSKTKDDVKIVFMQIEKVKKMNQLSVHNNILMELFLDQINLIHVTKNEKLQSLKLDIEKNEGVLNWD